jgi:hypothetical protein
MAPYLNWLSGDRLSICVKVEDLCGASNYMWLKSADIQPFGTSCTLTCDYPDCHWTCINVVGRAVTIKAVMNRHSVINDGLCSNVSADKVYHELGTVITDSQGIASLVYTVTEQDRLDYINAVSLGGTYDIVACSSDSLITQHAQVFSAVTITQNLCLGVPCGDKCFGTGLWAMKCDPLTGACVQDVLKQANSVICSATHVFEYNLNYLPLSFLNLIGPNIVTISDALGNYLIMPTGVQYLGSTYSNGIFQVYVKQTMVLASIPQTIVNLAGIIGGIIIFILGAIIVVVLGTPAAIIIGAVVAAFGALALVFSITDLLAGSKSTGQAPGLTNKQLTDAGAQFMTELMDGCVTKTCIDPTLTQDQKALCVKNCVDNGMTNWKDYQKNLFPNADHSPLDTGANDVQQCYNTYISSGKTATDFQTYLTCIKLKRDTAVQGDNANILKKYDPNAPAGAPCAVGFKLDPTTNICVAVEDCWIPSPVPTGGCILSASTGKTIALVGGLLIVGYIGYGIIKKR